MSINSSQGRLELDPTRSSETLLLQLSPLRVNESSSLVAASSVFFTYGVARTCGFHSMSCFEDNSTCVLYKTSLSSMMIIWLLDQR